MRSPFLTSRAVLGKVDFPNRTGVAVAFAMPHMAIKSGFFRSCRHSISTGVGTYWQGDVRVSVRPRRLFEPGSVALPFFVPNPLIEQRCLMSSQSSLSAHELAQLQEIVREHTRQLALAAVWLSELKSEVADLQNTVMPRSVAIPKRRRGKAVIIPFPSEVSHV